MEQDRRFIAQARRHAALSRRVRNRARLDIVLIGIATGVAAHLAEGSHQALMAASLVLSFGILVYVIRRDRDLTELAGTSRWREDAIEGRGLTLEDWRSGADLPPWDLRQHTPVGRPEIPTRAAAVDKLR